MRFKSRSRCQPFSARSQGCRGALRRSPDAGVVPEHHEPHGVRRQRETGDAYEYLLKTAEAQADAGQFRTPRHIIDFIVKIINPQKHEVVIDPACGTAGFLVSAYQHVKSQHELSGGGTTLSTPDLVQLADNLNGYDISPEMTKLAMANMYLHTQNKNPNIDNYDTLTSTDHWNKYADVMLANPPFMTPRGGIRPLCHFPGSLTRHFHEH